MRTHLRWWPNGEFLEVIQMETSSNDSLATTNVSSSTSHSHIHSQTDDNGLRDWLLLLKSQLALAPETTDIMILLSGMISLGTGGQPGDWRENLVCEMHQSSVNLHPDLADVRSDLVLIKTKSEKSLDVAPGGNSLVPGPGLPLNHDPHGGEAGRANIVIKQTILLGISWSRDLNAGVKTLGRDGGRGRVTAPSWPSTNCDIRNWFTNQNNSLPGAGGSAARHRNSVLILNRGEAGETGSGLTDHRRHGGKLAEQKTLQHRSSASFCKALSWSYHAIMDVVIKRWKLLF